MFSGRFFILPINIKIVKKDMQTLKIDYMLFTKLLELFFDKIDKRFCILEVIQNFDGKYCRTYGIYIAQTLIEHVI